MNEKQDNVVAVTHRITSEWDSGMRFIARSEQVELMMDAASGAEATSRGWPPKKLMLAALTGCTGMDVVSLLMKMRVPFTHVRITAQAKLTDEHPRMYQSVHLIYQIGTENTYRDNVEKAVSLSQEKYCGVSAMFKKFAQLTYEIILDSSAVAVGSER